MNLIELTEWLVYGHRPNKANRQSGPGTLPLGTPGERPGGSVAPAPAIAAPTSPEPVAKEIIAWRSWVVDQEEPGRLLSHNGTPWEGPALVASKVPNLESQEGIYALRKERLDTSGYAQHAVIGEVALSGIVLEGQHGYRAERAVIRSLLVYFWRPSQYRGGSGITFGYLQPEVRIAFPDTNALDFLSRLEERYKCPVEVKQWPVAPAATQQWHRVNMVRVVQSTSTHHSEQYLEAYW